MVGIDHAGPDGPVAVYDYALDEAGNRVGVVTLDGTESYVLDELNRLLSTSYVDGTSEAFSYDPAGNRLTHTDTGGTTTYAYDLAGRLATTVGPDGITSYTHDPAGRLTATSDGTTYTYDSAGRLTEAAVDGVIHSFVHDADGVRVEVNGQAQLWDRTGALPTLVHDGQPHTWAPGGLLSTDGSWALTDALGSVRGLVDTAGGLTASVDYRAFGQPTTPWAGFGFTGGIHDPTGQIHLRARQLDPGLGRFSTRDPIQPGAPGTGGYNLYTYVANNPTTWVDPTGTVAISTEYLQLFEAALVATGVAVGGAVILTRLSELAVHVEMPDIRCTLYRQCKGDDDDRPNPLPIPPEIADPTRDRTCVRQTRAPQTPEDCADHRGRIQVQGRSLRQELSWAWSGPIPPTAAEGLAGLEGLWLQLPRSGRRLLDQAFEQARTFIRHCAPVGCPPPGKNGMTNRGVRGSDARVDIEIITGVAFT